MSCSNDDKDIDTIGPDLKSLNLSNYLSFVDAGGKDVLKGIPTVKKDDGYEIDPAACSIEVYLDGKPVSEENATALYYSTLQDVDKASDAEKQYTMLLVNTRKTGDLMAADPTAQEHVVEYKIKCPFLFDTEVKSIISTWKVERGGINGVEMKLVSRYFGNQRIDKVPCAANSAWGIGVIK